MRFTLTAVLAASLAQRPQGFAAPGLGSLRNRSRALRSSARATSRSVSDFTTSELKRLLSERNIDFRDCLEKSELVARLQAALRGDLGDPDEGSAFASLSEGERNTVRLFERVAPSVAFIQTSTVRSAGPLSLRGEVVPQGSGSGFVWDDEGHVVTNYHVIQQV